MILYNFLQFSVRETSYISHTIHSIIAIRFTIPVLQELQNQHDKQLYVN